jgi:hypothetical protein
MKVASHASTETDAWEEVDRQSLKQVPQELLPVLTELAADCMLKEGLFL